MLERLLVYSPNINEKDQFGNALLHYICLYNHHKLLEKVLEMDCILTTENTQGMQPMHVCVIGNSLECFLLILNKRGRKVIHEEFIIKTTKQEQNCLHLAVIHNSFKIFDYCLECLSHFDHQDINGKTALMFSVQHDRRQCTEVLIQKGASKLMRDARGNNLLYYILAKQETDLFFVTVIVI
jgi:ankyrin repeat protein